MKMTLAIIFFAISFFTSPEISAQDKNKDPLLTEKTFSGLEFRSIGPALNPDE
jgi:hypothetical protein